MADLLVVGGAGGVGSAVVSKLVERGDKVTTTVLSRDEANRVRVQHGDAVAVHEVDLGNADEALSKFRSIVSSGSNLDAVVFCAAIAPNGPTEVVALHEFRRMLEINFISNIAVYQAALPALRESKGRIIFISSVAGKRGVPMMGAYTASKFALEGAADVMRREAANQDVSVVLVEPGGIHTEMLTKLPGAAERVARLPKDQAERYGSMYHRWHDLVAGFLKEGVSTPEQVAGIVLEALDAKKPRARYIAGADAQRVLDMCKAMTDEEADEYFIKMYIP